MTVINSEPPPRFARECGPGGLEGRAVAELRASGAGEAPTISGYGSVADQPTTISGMFEEWTEEVAPGAWAASIADGDIRSMYNHEPPVLARTKAGTLHLSEDANGLAYRIDVNADDPAAMGVHARVQRGDVDGSSVFFRATRQEWTYPTDQNDLEMPHRRILEAQLFETGPVDFPAFEQTTAQARSLAPLDVVLRAAGVTKGHKRARLAADLLADPDALEDELRRILNQNPELRSTVCSCEANGRAAVSAPQDGAADTAPEPGQPQRTLAIARARLLLMSRSAI